MSVRRAALAAVVALSASLGFATPSQGVAEQAANTWIVTLHAGESPRQVAAEHAHENSAEIVYVYEHALNGYAARMSPRAADRIANDRRVASVVADRPVSIDAKGGKPGGGGSTQPAEALPFGVQRIGGAGGAAVNVDVAVLDTGVQRSHPDLNVVGGTSCITGEAWDADGNGHGTHVGGTIGAIDNSIGVVGVAPGARLHSVKVLSRSGSGSWASVICGIDWVKRNAATIEVANMSLGGGGSDTGCNDGGLHKAICDTVGAGVTFVVAAGNSAANSATQVPAAYDEVITVSALADFNGLAGGGAPATCRADVDDTFADFSNFGSDVDLIAPGVCITSTWKGGGYNTISGTSMAAPHVAGAAALHKAADPNASPSDVQTALQNAGTLSWNNSDDGDATQEPLLHV